MKNRAAIVGIGQSRFARRLEASETVLACQAVRAALDDAGLSVRDVDGLVSSTLEETSEVELAANLGMGDITFFTQVGYGGGGGCGTVGHAALAVSAGLCSVAVVWRSRKRGSGPRPWQVRPMTRATPDGPARADDWYRPYGLLRPVDEIAMLARRYFAQYGATRDHLANVALAFRAHALDNPDAIMHGRPLTREQYLSSRWISEPLCLFDNCLETDGAVAFVVVAADRAQDCPHSPVVIHAAAQGFGAGQVAMTNYHTAEPLRGPSRTCAAALWRQADVGPDDVDVAQLYDAFTPLILFSLEGYGFCGEGEGAAFTEAGNIAWPGGRLPLNTSGGSLSEAYVHGYNLITEGVRQIRGTSGCQVPDAEVCLVASGDCVPTSALLLVR